MLRRHSLSGQHQSCREIALYHSDLLASLRLMFAQGGAAVLPRYVGHTPAQMKSVLSARREELVRRSSFALLAALEAAFRVDFALRCSERRRDPLSRAFRVLHRQHGDRPALEEHILPQWKRHTSQRRGIISDIIGAFKYRHWLAHGRYWKPKLGRKYTYEYVYYLVDEAVRQLPLVS